MLRAILRLTVAVVIAAFGLTTAGWPQAPSSPSVKAPVVKKSPLAPYAGIWTATSQGRTFVTLRLTQNGDQLSGTLQHPVHIDTDNNGEVKNFSDDSSSAVVQESKLTGDGVLLTVKDDASNEVDRFSMQMTGDATATLKMLAMAMPAGMAKPKPWKLTRTTAAGGVPAPQ